MLKSFNFKSISSLELSRYLPIIFLVAGVALSFARNSRFRSELPWYSVADQDATIVPDALAIGDGYRPRRAVHPGFGHRYLWAVYYKAASLIKKNEYLSLKKIKGDPVKFFPAIINHSRFFAYLVTTIATGLSLALLIFLIIRSSILASLGFLLWVGFSGVEVQSLMVRPEPLSLLFSILSICSIFFALQQNLFSVRRLFLFLGGVLLGLGYYTKIQVLPYILIFFGIIFFGSFFFEVLGQGQTQRRSINQSKERAYFTLLSICFLTCISSYCVGLYFKQVFLFSLGIIAFSFFQLRGVTQEIKIRIEDSLVAILGFFTAIGLIFLLLLVFLDVGQARSYVNDIINAAFKWGIYLDRFGTNKSVSVLLSKTWSWGVNELYLMYFVHILLGLPAPLLWAFRKKSLRHIVPSLLLVGSFLYLATLAYRYVAEVYLVYPIALFVLFLIFSNYFFLKEIEKQKKSMRPILKAILFIMTITPLYRPSYMAKKSATILKLGVGTETAVMRTKFRKFSDYFGGRNVLPFYEDYNHSLYIKRSLKESYKDTETFLRRVKKIQKGGE